MADFTANETPFTVAIDRETEDRIRRDLGIHLAGVVVGSRHRLAELLRDPVVLLKLVAATARNRTTGARPEAVDLAERIRDDRQGAEDLARAFLDAMIDRFPARRRAIVRAFQAR